MNVLHLIKFSSMSVVSAENFLPVTDGDIALRMAHLSVLIPFTITNIIVAITPHTGIFNKIDFHNWMIYPWALNEPRRAARCRRAYSMHVADKDID